METKKCRDCEEIKILSKFHKKPGSPFGVNSRCKICRNAFLKDKDRKLKLHEYNKINSPENLVCSFCGDLKPLSNFLEVVGNSNGYSFRCKDCQYVVNDPGSIGPFYHKICKICKKYLLASKFFNRRSVHKDGFRPECTKCVSFKRKNSHIGVYESLPEDFHKKCRLCGNSKHKIFFYKNTGSVDGLRSICKECQNKQNVLQKTQPYVYLVFNPLTNLLKIGFSTTLKRFSQISRISGNSFLRILKILVADKMYEKLLHAKFSNFKIKSEWFQLQKEILNEFNVSECLTNTMHDSWFPIKNSDYRLRIQNILKNIFNIGGVFKDSKICCRCGNTKNLDVYYKNVFTPDGHTACCIDCHPIKNVLDISGVYCFLNTETLQIKIGYSTGIKRRLGQVSGMTGNTLKLIWCFETGDKNIEKEIQYYYFEYRKYGEWFNVSPNNLCEYLSAKYGNSMGRFESLLKGD